LRRLVRFRRRRGCGLGIRWGFTTRENHRKAKCEQSRQVASSKERQRLHGSSVEGITAAGALGVPGAIQATGSIHNGSTIHLKDSALTKYRAVLLAHNHRPRVAETPGSRNRTDLDPLPGAGPYTFFGSEAESLARARNNPRAKSKDKRRAVPQSGFEL